MRIVGSTILHRVGSASAMVMLAVLGTAVAVQSPAQGVPPGGCAQSHYYQIDSSSHDIHAYNYLACENGDVEALATNISRFSYEENGTSKWTSVASGYGHVVYHCNGNGYNQYRVASFAPFFNTCG